MTWLRSLLYQILFLGWTLLISLGYLPMLALASRRQMQYGAKWWLDVALWLQRHVLGITFRIEGRAHIPPGGVIFAAKHQSAWETLVFHHLVGDPTFIIKKELLSLPFIGWYLAKTGQIAIDRKDGSRALKMMIDRARKVLQEGRPVIIFPEGHRQAAGTTGRYHAGIAMLYNATEAPILPVALNSGLFWPRNAFLRRAGEITLRILPPIPRGLDRSGFLHALEQAIETETRQLEAAAVARQPYLATMLSHSADHSGEKAGIKSSTTA